MWEILSLLWGKACSDCLPKDWTSLMSLGAHRMLPFSVLASCPKNWWRQALRNVSYSGKNITQWPNQGFEHRPGNPQIQWATHTFPHPQWGKSFLIPAAVQISMTARHPSQPDFRSKTPVPLGFPQSLTSPLPPKRISSMPSVGEVWLLS